MSPAFTEPATERLAQLARSALEEEQYDLGVQCISQLASLGWHPTSDLIRCLFAISMCELPESSSRNKAVFKSNGQLPKLSSKVVESTMGPDTRCIMAATKLLEHISTIAGHDIIFQALLPISSASNEDEDSHESEANRQQTRSFSINGRGIEDEEDTSSSDHTSILRMYTDQMKNCESFWQVLALGDMMDKAKSKKKRKEKGRDNREGEEVVLCNASYDREAIWRIMDVILQGWSKINIADKEEMTQLASILVPDTRKKKPQKGKRGVSKIHPSVDIGEVFEVIHAGLAPSSLLCTNEDVKMSRKHKVAERHQRGSIAAELLIQLYFLVPKKLVDRDAMLTRVVSLLKKLDVEASRLVFKAMKRASFGNEITMAGLMCIDWTDDEDHLNSEIKRYTDAFLELERDYDGKGNIGEFLAGVECFDWFFPLKKDYFQKEDFLMDLFWRDDRTSIEKLSKDNNVNALLEGPWSVQPLSRNAKDSRPKVLSPSVLTWEKLAFATTWRKATMQLNRNFAGLQMEVIIALKSKIQQANPDVKTTYFSTCSMDFLKEEYTGYRLAYLKSCCTEMSIFLDKKQNQGARPNTDREKKFERQARQNVTECIDILELLTNEMKMVRLAISEEGHIPTRQSRSSDEVQMSI